MVFVLYRFLALLLSLVMVCVPTLCRASNNAESILIMPINDGNDDDLSESFSRLLEKNLSSSHTWNLIDIDKVKDVIFYHDIYRPTFQFLADMESSLADAKKDFFEFKYAASTSKLKAIIKSIKSRSNDIVATGHVLQDAYVSLAAVMLSMHKRQRCAVAFDDALKNNPSLRLSESDFSPSLLRIFERERTKILALASASIRVDSKPKAAQVLLNGIPQGVTPIKISKVPSGVYKISIVADKYVPFEQDINVQASDERLVDTKLIWAGKSGSSRSIEIGDAMSELALGLRAADVIKVDKVILIDVDTDKKNKVSIRAHMVDRKYRAGYRPVVSKSSSDIDLDIPIFGQAMTKQMNIDLGRISADQLYPAGIIKPIFLKRRKKSLTKNPIFWCSVGAVVLGALAGGLAAALSGGGDSPKDGTVRVRFK